MLIEKQKTETNVLKQDNKEQEVLERNICEDNFDDETIFKANSDVSHFKCLLIFIVRALKSTYLDKI